ncbi:MAG: beta-mannosidase, partial [Candidatus Hydrogenedentes bacterium]|nr:beta-mannosidase [Candidatus Hydrogenedentota bacterium]
SSVALIEHYAGHEPYWPPTTPWWMHISAWWLQWDTYGPELGAMDQAQGLAQYVQRTQTVQAQAYAIAAQRCKQRFPACGGFIIWMGHDCYPCPINNSVIDFDRQPKPAYHALREVFR